MVRLDSSAPGDAHPSAWLRPRSDVGSADRGRVTRASSVNPTRVAPAVTQSPSPNFSSRIMTRLVALTPTPALHTKEISWAPVFSYPYREALVDGSLVDHEPPIRIVTNSLGVTGWRS